MKLLTLDLPVDVKKEKLLSCLRRHYPAVPEYALREAFLKRDVKVNGQRVGRDAQTQPGAKIQVYLPENRVETIPILYRDEQVMVVRKPAGILCDKAEPGQPDLCELLREQLLEEEENPPLPLLCHRLDAPTEGVLLLALKEQAQEELLQVFREHRLEKEYLCQVRGCPEKEHAILRDYLYKDAKHGEVRVLPHPREGAKEIITEYQVEQPGQISLLRVRLHTGRTHQIRAHLAYYGYPLLGDDQYGDRSFNREKKARRLHLCSAKLILHPSGPLDYLDGIVFSCEPSFGKEAKKP